MTPIIDPRTSRSNNNIQHLKKRKPRLLIHLLLMLLLSGLIVLLGVLGMYFFTRHGESVTIPHIQGMSLSEVKRLLSEVDLSYEIIDSVYSDDIAPGAVMDVTPREGAHVKPGRTIFIIINATSPKQGVIPSLQDVSERQAITTLQSLGFEHIEKSYIPGEFDDLVQGVQLASGQLLSPGTRVPLSTTLILLLSSALNSPLEDYHSDSIVGGEAIAIEGEDAPVTQAAPAEVPPQEEPISDDTESWM